MPFRSIAGVPAFCFISLLFQGVVNVFRCHSGPLRVRRGFAVISLISRDVSICASMPFGSIAGVPRICYHVVVLSRRCDQCVWMPFGSIADAPRFCYRFVDFARRKHLCSMQFGSIAGAPRFCIISLLSRDQINQFGYQSDPLG